MKKLFLATTLLAASLSASALGLTANYDYDRVNDGQRGLRTQQELSVSIPFATKYGTFDGVLSSRQLYNLDRDNTTGFEVGYSNGLKVYGLNVVGRAALGRQNFVDAGGGGFTGNAKYYSLAAEVSKPVTPALSAFVGFRHRNGFNAGAADAANRYSAGLDYTIGKNLAVRGGLTHTRQDGLVLNGVTTAVSYKF